jgi:hypothetical protein
MALDRMFLMPLSVGFPPNNSPFVASHWLYDLHFAKYAL